MDRVQDSHPQFVPIISGYSGEPPSQRLISGNALHMAGPAKQGYSRWQLDLPRHLLEILGMSNQISLMRLAERVSRAPPPPAICWKKKT